jgi:hypothetical protein
MAASLAAACGPAAAEIDFEPRIALAALWTDNIELAAPGQPADEELVGEALAAFRLSQRSSRVRSWLDYSLRHYEFTDDSDRNISYHEADGVFEAQVIADWFYLEGTAGYSQQIIDPVRPVNMTNNLFDVGNLTDTATALVSPRLSHEFGATRLDARYSRGFVDYRERDDLAGIPISDVDLEQRMFRFGSVPRGERILWGLLYSRVLNDYERTPDYLHERAALEGGVPVSSDVQLIAEAGRESDLPRSTVEGGFDSTYWLAGARYTPDRRTELVVRAGRRFFGTAIEGSFVRRSRLLTTRVSYVQEPTTEAQTFASGFGVEEEERNRPDGVGDRFGTLTTEPFVNRALNATLALSGRRTELTVGLVSSEREFISTGRSERRNGFNFRLERRLTSRNTLEVEVGADRTHFQEGGADDTIDASIAFVHRIGPQLAITVDVTHLERDGDVQEYSAEVAALRIVKDFR